MKRTSCTICLSLVLTLAAAAQDSQPSGLISKETFVKELAQDWEPPPPGARGIAIDPAPSVTVTLLFQYNSTELADEPSLKQLQEAAAAFKDPRLAAYQFIVEGHTDSDGSADYNLELSQRRAAAIVDLLHSQHGVAKDKLEPQGKGLTEPIADNSTDEGKQKNRRVVFIRK
jgi:outer membrane protein OmpA-like peptidoglycan-associated protein